MVIFHSYVSLPEGTDGAMEGWAPTPDTMASMQTKSPIAQSFPGTSAAPGVQTRSVHSNILPSGKRLHNYGKSPCSMGKSTKNGNFQ